MTDFLNTLTPYVAALFLGASIALAVSKNGYPLIMLLWFYHATLYWCTNSAIVIIYGHYMNPQLINMWSTAIAIQAASSVVATIVAHKLWKNKPEEASEV